jgi:hypothetical protein
VVKNESTSSIVLKFWLSLVHRLEDVGFEQPWFWPDGGLLPLQSSCLQCRSLEARNHQDLSAPGFHMCYKSKVPLVRAFMNLYLLTCIHRCHGILHGQQPHPIGRINYLVYNTRSLPNDTRSQFEKGEHTSIENTFHVD